MGMSTKCMFVVAVLLTAAALGPTVNAGVIGYSDETAFTGVLQNSFYQDLSGLRITDQPTVTDQSFGPGSGFGFSAHADNGLFSVDVIAPNIAGLSTVFPDDALVFSFSGSPTPVTAVGGNFFANDNAGTTVMANIEVFLTDGNSASTGGPLVTGSGFVGFVSNVPIASVTVRYSGAVDASNPVFPGAHDLYAGAATDAILARAGATEAITMVPLPSAALGSVSFLCALAGIGIVRRIYREHRGNVLRRAIHGA